MQASRLIRRAVPLILLGAAGAAAARRRIEKRDLEWVAASPPGGPAGGATAVEAGSGVPTVVDGDPAGPTVVDVEVLPDAPDPELAQGPTADAEAPTTEVPAVEQPPTSVTDIVDDLIAPHPAGDERIEDATVVEGDEPEGPSEGPPERR